MKPHEMTWSLKDFNNEETMDKLDAEQHNRLAEGVKESTTLGTIKAEKRRELDPDAKIPPLPTYEQLSNQEKFNEFMKEVE